MSDARHIRHSTQFPSVFWGIQIDCRTRSDSRWIVHRTSVMRRVSDNQNADLWILFCPDSRFVAGQTTILPWLILCSLLHCDRSTRHSTIFRFWFSSSRRVTVFHPTRLTLAHFPCVLEGIQIECRIIKNLTTQSSFTRVVEFSPTTRPAAPSVDFLTSHSFRRFYPTLDNLLTLDLQQSLSHCSSSDTRLVRQST